MISEEIAVLYWKQVYIASEFHTLVSQQSTQGLADDLSTTTN